MPDAASILHMANALIAQGRLAEARAVIEPSLAAIRPPADHPLQCLMCFLLTKSGEHTRAIEHIRRALASSPDEPNYLANLGKLQLLTGQLADAETTLRRVLTLAPSNLNAHIDLANLLESRYQYAAAAEQCRAGLRFHREHPVLANNEGLALLNLGLVEQAVARLRRAVAANPTDLGVRASLAGALNYLQNANAGDIALRHRDYGRLLWHYLPTPLPPPGDSPAARDPDRVLRVGFVSPDFRGHSVACFIDPILASLDRSRLTPVCYMTSSRTDATTARLRSLPGVQWRDVPNLNEFELASLVRQDRIDVLVDLAGHTRGQRLAVFHLRPAPVQIAYCGYPSTSGVHGVHFRLVDALTDPPARPWPGTEELLRIDGPFLCYKPPSEAPEVGPLPAQSSGHITFASFNALQKTGGAVIRIWSDLLSRVPGSRLLLKNPALSEERTRRDMAERFAAHGIDADRLELVGWSASTREHLDVYNRVDVALDTFPYAGATTTCEALLMGVPVVTLEGGTHAGRVGVSLLTAAGLGDWVAPSVDQYVQLAAALAADRDRLARLRAGLRARWVGSPACDARGFADRFQAGIRAAWRRHGDGSLPGFESPAPVPDDAPPLAAPSPAVAGALREAMSLLQAGDEPRARAVLEQAARKAPRDAAVADTLATVLLRAGDAARAAYAAEHALGASGNDPGLLHTHALALAATGRPDKAVPPLEKAIRLAPGWADPRAALAGLHNQRALFASAAALVEPIVRTNPGHVDASLALAISLLSMGRVEEAIPVLRAARDRNPGDIRLSEMWAFTLNYDPEATADQHFDAHLEYGVALERLLAPLPPLPTHPARTGDADGARLRIGLLSPDLRAHPVATFVEPIARHLDRSRFDLCLYHTGGVADDTSAALRSLATLWRHHPGPDPVALAQQIRKDGIDILIDLAGLTAQHRLAVMAMRPAPVQATFIGYPSTTGLERIHFRIVDATTDPAPAADLRATERLARLDPCFLCYSPPADAPPVSTAPPSHASGSITFGSLGSLLKANRRVLAAWADILRAVPASRLLIKNYGTQEPAVGEHLRARLAATGIDPSRLLILQPTLGPRGRTEHLGTYHQVDIALDTFPYAGTTTTCEALLMGVPVVSFAPEYAAHAHRVGRSLLSAAGCPELIADTADRYVALAAQLARDAERLAEYRRSLRARLLASPLCDGPAYAASFGTLLRRLWAARHEVAG